MIDDKQEYYLPRPPRLRFCANCKNVFSTVLCMIPEDLWNDVWKTVCPRCHNENFEFLKKK